MAATRSAVGVISLAVYTLVLSKPSNGLHQPLAGCQTPT